MIVADSNGPVVLGLLVLVLAVAAVVPAAIAHRKGYRSVWFYLFGFVAWPLATVVALAVSSRCDQVTVGTEVKVRTPVRVSMGTKIPAGYRASVLAEDVVDGRPVVQIADPLGEPRWIERANTVPA